MTLVGPKPLPKKAFLEAFDEVFSRSIRRQLTLGRLHRVTNREVAEARHEGDDACGAVGDLLLELPETAAPNFNDNELAFLRLVFRQQGQTLMLVKITGCS